MTDIRDIVREELINHLEGSGFWDLVKKAHTTEEAAKKSDKSVQEKKKRKPNEHAKERGRLIAEIMKEKGVKLGEAARILKERSKK